MTSPSSRRGFLRGLATLPLIGGGVTLIGKPTGTAVPITGGMLATYTAWLHFELRAVASPVYAKAGDSVGNRLFIPCVNPGSDWHDYANWDEERRRAQLRAPVILAAAGVPLTSPEADETWGGPIA